MSVLFDSSIYIAALRSRNGNVLSLRRSTNGPVWMSSVVLEELYAGSTRRDQLVVERLEKDFDRVGRILVPSLSDWTFTGTTLARIAQKYTYDVIGRGRMTNDALIAISAARKGVLLVTANERDFSRIAEFRPFRWQVWTS